MKNLSPDDRPREKLRSHGAVALGDNELVALVIGHGSRGGDALMMANALLAAHGGLAGREVEQFGVVLLDMKHRVIRTAMLATGTLNSTVVEPRDVYRPAVAAGAAAIVAFHNHPSGDPTPSPEDVDLTRRLAAAGVLIGVDLVDHLILGDRRYWSFKEGGAR